MPNAAVLCSNNFVYWRWPRQGSGLDAKFNIGNETEKCLRAIKQLCAPKCKFDTITVATGDNDAFRWSMYELNEKKVLLIFTLCNFASKSNIVAYGVNVTNDFKQMKNYITNGYAVPIKIDKGSVNEGMLLGSIEPRSNP